MSTGTKFLLVCCLALLSVGLFYRANLALDPARPDDMPKNARFLPTGYDLEHNERRGSWVSCQPAEDAAEKLCRVTDPHGVVIYQGNFLPVRSSVPSPHTDPPLDHSSLGWVDGPVEQSPVPLIPMSDGSVLVPRDDRDALLDRWNAHPDEWQRLQSAE